MRDHIRLHGGWYQPGKAELVIGKSVAARYPDAQIGKKIRLARNDWEVVGVMDAGSTAANSEMFADLNQLAAESNRTEALSSILLRAVDPVAVAPSGAEPGIRPQAQCLPQTEQAYYESQSSSGALFEYLGMFVAAIMAVGSAFAAMNTMYAAVARRAKEIGTLRVLGFSRIAILTSFLVESLALAFAGGLLGILLVLPLNGVTTGITGNTFSEVAFHFRVTPPIMVKGIVFALVLGAVGGLFPAGNAARKEILAALREA